MWEIEIPMKRCDKYVTYVTNVVNMLNILLSRAYNKSAKLRVEPKMPRIWRQALKHHN